jgi:hypothetical protein
MNFVTYKECSYKECQGTPVTEGKIGGVGGGVKGRWYSACVC